jgi:hypothetical protein
MKAILIDAQSETIKYVDVVEKNGSKLNSMYQHLGCELVDVINIDNKNDLFVDDEGLLKINDNTKFFIIQGYYQPLAGNGLILGFNNNDGDSTSTNLTVEEISKRVIFTDLNTLRTVKLMMEN